MCFHQSKTSIATVGKAYFSLSRERKQLFVQAFFLFFCLRLLLGRVAFKKIISFLSSRSKNRSPGRNPCVVEDILWSVQAASRRVPATTCLMNGLVADYLLKKNGVDAALCIGVRKTEEKNLAAHAWVTLDGKVIVGDVEDLDTYTVLSDAELLQL